MAITSMETLRRGIANGRVLQLFASSQSTQISGSYTSRWRTSGGVYPVQGATPSTFATPINTTTGALPLPTIGSEKIYIARIELVGSVISNWWVIDRLGHMGGMSGTTYTPTAQTANVTLVTPASTGRCCISGCDVDWFLEFYTATGSTAVTATVSYTDQTDTAGRTCTVSIPASTAAGRMIQIVPNADQYIKSVQTVTLSASTGTAGSFGVTAVKKLFGFSVPIASTAVILDAFGTGLPEVKQSSCISFMQMPLTTSSGTMTGNITLAVY